MGVEEEEEEEEENRQTREQPGSLPPSQRALPLFLASVPTAPEALTDVTLGDAKVIRDSPLLTAQSSRGDITRVRRDVLHGNKSSLKINLLLACRGTRVV